MTMTPKVVLLALVAEVMAGTLPAFHPSADAVAGTGDRKILGSRKWFERSHYSTLNISEFFLAELAWYALPDPAESKEKETVK